MIDRVFMDAKDQHVAANILYGDGTSALFVDSGKTTKVDHDTALDLCFKGLFVFVTDTYYPVTSFKDASGTLTVVVNQVSYTVTDSE